MDFILRKWRAEDAAGLADYASNPKIAANLRDAFPYPYTLDDARLYVESCAADPEERQLCRAVAIDGRAVGSVGVFLGSDVHRRCGELGYWLAEPYWGRGIMTEAVRRICREAFARFTIDRIYAQPFARNLGSRRVLEKAGFQLEGIMRRGVYKNGETLDCCMYALLRP